MGAVQAKGKRSAHRDHESAQTALHIDVPGGVAPQEGPELSGFWLGAGATHGAQTADDRLRHHL